MQTFDLAQLADRLHAAAERAKGLQVTVSPTDLIFSKDGYGTGKSESVGFQLLFLQPDRDLVGEALDRLIGDADPSQKAA